MSKYIVDTDDFEPMFKVDSIGVFGIGKSVTDNTEDHSWSRIKSLVDFEELNSDYINKHFGDLQDTAYKKGLHDGESKCGYCNEYQRGLDDAWEAARKIVEMADPPYWGVFNEYKNDLFGKISAAEAIAKLKAYEEKQKADDEIKVGDEVEISQSDANGIWVVIKVEKHDGYEAYCAINKDGDIYFEEEQDRVTKTGRHFDIKSILEDMRE